MTFIAFPSALALAIKIWLLFTAGSNLMAKQRELLFFMLALLALNSVELIGVTIFIDRPEDAGFFMQLYYASAFLSAAGFILIGASLWPDKVSKIAGIAVAVGAVLATLSLIPNAIVSGVESNGYSITAVPGDYYWSFQIFVPLCLIAGIALMAYAASHGADELNKKKSLILLVGLLPFVVTVITVITAMAIGINSFNASGIVSLSLCVFLAFLIWSEEKSKLFLLFSYTPFTEEQKLRRRFDELFRASVIDSEGEFDFRSQRQQFENLLIDYALYANGNKVTETAKKLGIAPVTIYRKLNGDAAEPKGA